MVSTKKRLGFFSLLVSLMLILQLVVIAESQSNFTGNASAEDELQ